MELANTEVELKGQTLIQTVVSLTGLPHEWITYELNQILVKYRESKNRVGHEKESQEVTLRELRQAITVYLESFGLYSQ